MDLNDDRSNDDIEQEHDQLLRGDGVGGFGGLNIVYTLWGRKTVYGGSILILALAALTGWWFASG